MAQDAHLKRFLKRSSPPFNDLELCQQNVCQQPPAELAVCVRNAHKRYGSWSDRVIVLEALDMTVPKGAIYGLLGASGCGKTTLLNCILGRKKLDAGEVWVLGGTPNTKASGVPGPRVGYMPQQTALYGDFTIKETMLYYGWVAGMSTEAIKQRFEFLRALLLLSNESQLVKTLSGGQSRRVSLAVALLSEPELLVLDEPTVGVDPILRETIWQYLVQIAGKREVTIIITTHYIEEARQAHVVALMRKGHFLEEDAPEKLMVRHGTNTLEEIYYKLSARQSFGKAKLFITAIDGKEETDTSLPTMPPQEKYAARWSDYLPNLKLVRLNALVWKGLVWMMRNIFAMVCVILLPAMQIPIFCLAVGNDPIHVPVAVVNYETGNSMDCNRTLTCAASQLSCVYLDYLETRALDLTYYDTEEAALESVLRGETYASIVVRRNYSAALRNRIEKWEGTKEWDMAASEIDVVRDIASKHISIQLKVYFYETFQTFIQDFVESCGYDRRVMKLPIKWETPIYGAQRPNFTEFVLPGILVLLTFFLSVASTALGMLIERNEGSFERTFVMGITEVELLSSHLICQTLIMVLQAAISLLCAFVMFDMTHNGSMALVVVYIVLTGFLGMCYGLLLSCLCDSENAAMFLAVGSVFPMLILCGIVWPIEAAHPLLRFAALVLPITLSVEGLRSILQRGWGLLAESVYLGFASTAAWSAVLMALCLLTLKFKKS